ncbi:MAG: amino acid permease [Reichenbachiella sp.]|uniref:amino acid permease n=2 Tax=Reichenbachiella sp. TaxID=2184521 RepID=UPI0032969C61
MSEAKGKIGLWTSTALVTGNMIGSGIFLLPASLAFYGGISLLGWVFTATGALLLAKVFSYLSRLVPASGGPYAYTKAAFGDFAAFLVAWGYWISCWCTNAAIVIAFIAYLGVFFPILSNEPLVGLTVAIFTVWFLVWVNSQGIRKGGNIQVVTTILKLIPLLSIAIFGLFYINLDHFTPFNLSEESNFDALGITATMTLWAFLGIESATIPAGNVKDPKNTIPKASMLGTIIASVAYILSSFAIMGIVDPASLQTSTAPFADAGALMWGENARYFIAFGAAASCFGALNGWTILLGQMPLAASEDRLFPRVFRKKNEHGVPVLGMVLSTILVSGLIMMNFSESLVKQYEFIILLATLTCLVPYLFSMAGFVIISIQKKIQFNPGFRWKLLLATLAFSYSLWAVIGSGSEIVYYGFILLMAGIPFYALIQWNKNK